MHKIANFTTPSCKSTYRLDECLCHETQSLSQKTASAASAINVINIVQVVVQVRKYLATRDTLFEYFRSYFKKIEKNVKIYKKLIYSCCKK